MGINEGVWKNIHQLPVDFTPLPWEDLRLDAQAALPHVGTAVVLAATSLEVFISQILDRLAATSDLPADVWKWLNDRGAWARNPTTEEQFDILLRHFTGHSLKDNQALWKAFKNLRTARNSFVHEGIAKVGDKVLLHSDAENLVARANDIISWVRGCLPADRRWLEFEPSITFQIEKGFPERPNPPLSEAH